MCDTLFVPRGGAPAGPAFFAKNSDRNPDEPQVMTLAAGPRWASLLSRPVWMRGAEIGINARGVVIGNEAVFPRWKTEREGVLGMETLRLALEEAATAAEAVSFIGHFVETHPQGGNGAYKGEVYYDNSYLVADFTEAWIVETAGRRWAARRATGPAAISNCYSLSDDFDRSDPVTTAERKPGYSWKRRVGGRPYGMLMHGDFRRSCSLAKIGNTEVGIDTVLSVMRSHGPRLKGTRSVCMHGGGPVNIATTSSMIVEMYPAERKAVLWFTASPAPCLSVYRPAVLENGSFRLLWTDYDYREDSERSLEYWKRRRSATSVLERTAPRDPGFAARRDAAQRRLLDLMAGRATMAGDAEVVTEIRRVVNAFEEESVSP
jgi:secernin